MKDKECQSSPAIAKALVKAEAPASNSGRKNSPTAAIANGKQSPFKPKREDVITGDPACNITEAVYVRMGCSLHTQPNHPLAIVKAAIHEFLDRSYPGGFTKFDDLPPVVSTSANFDAVRIPADHSSRSPSSTYFCSKTKSLRWHMLAHVRQMLQARMEFTRIHKHNTHTHTRMPKYLIRSQPDTADKPEMHSCALSKTKPGGCLLTHKPACPLPVVGNILLSAQSAGTKRVVQVVCRWLLVHRRAEGRGAVQELHQTLPILREALVGASRQM